MRYNLCELHVELKAAGIDVPALGLTGDVVHTYDAEGVAIDLPKAAAKVVKAHRPQPTPQVSALAALRASGNPDIKALMIVLGLA